MATGTLVNGSATITAQKQNNTIVLSTSGKYVPNNITLNVNVTKAVLTTASGSNSFDIQVPNGTNGTVTFHFAVDANGNTLVTQG